jgi:two-component system chemotaxis response regulator CheY
MPRIMLVDDDRALLNIASALLVHAQFDVICCESAIEALDQIRKQEFDVIITDANMSPHSGFDLIRSVKTIPSYDLVPIAMLTGRREKRDVERALSVGAQDYIVKPLDPGYFIKKVTELASLSETNRRTARFAEIKLNEVAVCEVGLVLIGLTEQGLLLDSDHHLNAGTVIRVESDLLTKIGVPRPQARVTSCTIGKIEGTFEIRTKFEALDEKGIAKIRAYIHSRVLNDKRSMKAS